MKNLIYARLHHRKGSALLLVLGTMVLITILVVGLLMQARSERSSSANYRTTAFVGQLAETAVNLVEGQVIHATTQGAASTVWASQPGAIRLFNSDGTLHLIYRLYSSTAMTTATVADLANDLPPTTWSASPGLWTDLNAPVITTSTAGGTKVTSYPILDIRDPADSTKTIVSSSGTTNTHPMEGFGLTNPPGATTLQPAPMPVRWLYVLQNGEIVTPDTTSTGTQVTFSNATPKPSASDPIVGRVAFWTDDETCKLNINTASTGAATFWDSPRFNYQDDRDLSGAGLALHQPAIGEFQRYPGHPATTTLNKVFTSIAPILTTTSLFNLLPRYLYGGSSEATISVTGATAITPPTNRLFTSIGELLFDPSRNPDGLTRQQLETSRFFLTAHSRAPEVNLFGKPRVSIWPASSLNDTSHRSAIDQLINFCATVNGHPYYFTRQDSTSSTIDLNLTRNQALLSYLDTETSTTIPGFGGDFKTKYGTDQRQILTEIFDYVRATNLRDSTPGIIPYADNSSTPSFNAGGGQVTPTINTTWGTQGEGRFDRISEASLLFIGMGRGAITSPSSPAIPVYSDEVPTYTGGTGMVPPNDNTAVQAFLLLNFFDPAQGYSQMNPSFTVVASGLDGLKYDGQAMGFPATATCYIGGGIASTPETWLSAPLRSGILDFRVMTAARMLGTTDASNYFQFYSNILTIPNSHTNPALVGGSPVTISVYSGNSTAAAKLIQTVQITFPASQAVSLPGVEPDTTSAPIYSHRRFGTADFYKSSQNSAVYPAPSTVQVDRAAMYNSQANFYTYMFNYPYDRTLSMVPSAAWADSRLLAVSSVPSSAFVVHPSAGGPYAYGLRTSGGTPMMMATMGHLIKNAATSTQGADNTPPRPDAVSAVVNGAFIGGGTTGTVGDWDNSVGDSADGPYINKADEGSIYVPSGSTTMPYWGAGSFGSTSPGATFFTPNRQVCSPVTFGSLPTGVLAGKAWQTLLFRPGPTGHPGMASPKDHLMLDLFWMPVAQPYAISEPFSTAGKVNLNYEIEPFTYITRDTALRSVLASEKIASIPFAKSATYKTDVASNTGNARLALNLSDGVTDTTTDTGGTLRQFQDKFNGTGSFSADGPSIFKSATEICDIFLVPAGSSWTTDANAQAGWYGTNFSMVGDNTREKPYDHIYPRVTTKSNVYTVYVTAQTLKNVSTDPTVWTEGTGVISGEYRGSTTLERYIDPNNTSIPDYAIATGVPTLDTFYKWRIVANSQFSP